MPAKKTTTTKAPAKAKAPTKGEWIVLRDFTLPDGTAHVAGDTIANIPEIGKYRWEQRRIVATPEFVEGAAFAAALAATPVPDPASPPAPPPPTPEDDS